MKMALCQPSERSLVPRGLEPRTLRLLAARSDQLSYETSEASGEQQDMSMRLKLGSRRCGDQERTGPIRPVLAPMGGESIRTSKKKLGGEPRNIEKLCAMGYYLQTGAHENGLVSALRKKLGPMRA